MPFAQQPSPGLTFQPNGALPSATDNFHGFNTQLNLAQTYSQQGVFAASPPNGDIPDTLKGYFQEKLSDYPQQPQNEFDENKIIIRRKSGRRFSRRRRLQPAGHSRRRYRTT